MTAAVWCHTQDPSAFYRLTEPARVLGVPVVETTAGVGGADTVITNRPLFGSDRAVIDMWVREGRRVIVDIDDDFDTIPPGHKLHGRFHTRHLHAACEAATVVTCSTPALVDRYGHGHGVVVRNGVPESYLSIARRHRREPRPWVGWYASLASHPHDAPVLGDALAKAQAEHPDMQVVYAGPERDAPILSTLWQVDVQPFGFFSMQGLMQWIAELDVGVVPLDLSPFNTAKSWLKGLEFAAVGVPVIASPTGEYRQLAVRGGCITAAGPGDWAAALTDLLADDETRRVQAARGRAFAATQTYEARADEWRHIWLP